MIKRLGLGFLLLVVAIVVLPPLWYALFPGDPAPELPPAGRRVVLPNGVGINVLELGSGAPVVLVHGLPGSAYEWRNVTKELAARGRHVYAIDRSGYGHSDPNPDRDNSLARNVSDVIALLDALDLDDVTLVGWSYGGATASVVAMRQPERLGSLVLVGTGGPTSADEETSGPPALPGFMRFLYSDPVLFWRSRVPPIRRGLIEVSSRQAYSDNPMPDWWLPGVEANFAREDTVLTYRDEMFGLGSDVEGESFAYDTIEVPTLLLHGDDDRLAPVEIARYLVTRIPGARKYEYVGGSHMIPVTHGQDMAERIIAFSARPRTEPMSALEASGASPTP